MTSQVFLPMMHSSLLSVCDVNHDGVRRKPIKKVILENVEHDRTFHVDIKTNISSTILWI